MSRRPALVSGWCQNGRHDKCPGLLRATTTTPKGKLLRELLCACKERCHK